MWCFVLSGSPCAHNVDWKWGAAAMGLWPSWVLAASRIPNHFTPESLLISSHWLSIFYITHVWQQVKNFSGTRTWGLLLSWGPRSFYRYSVAAFLENLSPRVKTGNPRRWREPKVLRVTERWFVAEKIDVRGSILWHPLIAGKLGSSNSFGNSVLLNCRQIILSIDQDTKISRVMWTGNKNKHWLITCVYNCPHLYV